MSAMQVVVAIIVACIPIVASGLIALGVVRGKMHSYLTYEKHREICNDKRDDIDSRINRERNLTDREIDKLVAKQDTTLRLVSEIHGFLKAQNGGAL